MSELGGDERPKHACLGENRESAAVDPGDAAWHGTLDGSITERSLEGRSPTEFGKWRPRIIGSLPGGGGYLR